MKLLVNGNKHLTEMYEEVPLYAVGKIRVMLDGGIDSPAAYRHDAVDDLVEVNYTVRDGEFMNVMESGQMPGMYLIQPQMDIDILIPIDGQTLLECIELFDETDGQCGFEAVIWNPADARPQVEIV